MVWSRFTNFCFLNEGIFEFFYGVSPWYWLWKLEVLENEHKLTLYPLFTGCRALIQTVFWYSTDCLLSVSLFLVYPDTLEYYHLIHSTGYNGNWNRDWVVVSFNVCRSSFVGGSLPHIKDLVPVESVLSSSRHSWAWNIQKWPLLQDSIQDLQGNVTWYPTWLPQSAQAKSLIWQQQLLVQ